MSAKVITEFYGWGAYAVLWNNCGNCPDSPGDWQNLQGFYSTLGDQTIPRATVRMGSGFIVHDDQIATNYHVVEDMLSGTARLDEKAKKYRVKILVVDKMRDLAIVTATGIDAPALPLGNSDTVQQGDTVYVMGNPRGLVATLSPGIISAIRPAGTYLTTFRLFGSDPLDWYAPCKLLQMTAPTSKGSSGGPVLNESGEVIGIVFGGVPSFLEPDLTVTTPENLNFAIAVNYLKQLAKGRVYQSLLLRYPHHEACSSFTRIRWRHNPTYVGFNQF